MGKINNESEALVQYSKSTDQTVKQEAKDYLEKSYKTSPVEAVKRAAAYGLWRIAVKEEGKEADTSYIKFAVSGSEPNLYALIDEIRYLSQGRYHHSKTPEKVRYVLARANLERFKKMVSSDNVYGASIVKHWETELASDNKLQAFLYQEEPIFYGNPVEAKKFVEELNDAASKYGALDLVKEMPYVAGVLHIVNDRLFLKQAEELNPTIVINDDKKIFAEFKSKFIFVLDSIKYMKLSKIHDHEDFKKLLEIKHELDKATDLEVKEAWQSYQKSHVNELEILKPSYQKKYDNLFEIKTIIFAQELNNRAKKNPFSAKFFGDPEVIKGQTTTTENIRRLLKDFPGKKYLRESSLDKLLEDVRKETQGAFSFFRSTFTSRGDEMENKYIKINQLAGGDLKTKTEIDTEKQAKIQEERAKADSALRERERLVKEKAEQKNEKIQEQRAKDELALREKEKQEMEKAEQRYTANKQKTTYTKK